MPGRLRLRQIVERRILPEDGALEVAEGASRLDTELFDELLARFPINGKRIRLSPRSVERRHEQPREAFPIGMRRGEALQLGDEVRTGAALELCFKPPFVGGQAQLVEPSRLAACIPFQGNIREYVSTAECECLG